jgi:hypothetical protein
VTTRLVPNGAGAVMAIMIADSSGVYEAIYDGSANPSETLPLRWMMPNEAYRVLRRSAGTNQPTGANAPLRATFARRLDSGDVLIVNGYYGPRRDGQAIGGEVIQIDGTTNVISTVNTPNMGFSSRSIMFELPPISGARGLVTPVYADRR